MKVRCINSKLRTPFLNEGQIYEVEEDHYDYYVLVGVEHTHKKSRFQVVSEGNDIAATSTPTSPEPPTPSTEKPPFDFYTYNFTLPSSRKTT